MTFLKRLAGISVASLFALSGAPAQQSPRHPLIVDGAWLERRIADTSIVVLHAVSGRGEYDAGHVPRARPFLFASYAIQSGGLNAQIAPVAQLDSLLEDAGVSDDKHVVIYGQSLAMARLFVTLEYLGLTGRVSILDGGIDAWREEGRRISRDTSAVARGSFTPRVKADVVAEAPWILANSGKPGVALLDARTPEFYLGVSAGQMPRAGHIPGARNIPFSSLTSDLTRLRDVEKLRRLFEGAGVKKGSKVVTYCHIGMQASLLYTVSRALGYETQIYDGSFDEWSRKTELPVVGPVK